MHKLRLKKVNYLPHIALRVKSRHLIAEKGSLAQFLGEPKRVCLSDTNESGEREGSMVVGGCGVQLGEHQGAIEVSVGCMRKPP